jgi:Flp pilus assembly protein TadD
LAQAGDLLNAGDVHDATKLYTTVLNQDPNDPQALAQLGWLAYEQGVKSNNSSDMTAGETLEARAISKSPDFGAAHLYQGVILGQNGDPAGAVQQFKLFLSEDPSAQNLRNGAPFIRKYYAEEHQPVPANVPAVTATTTPAPHPGSAHTP